MSVIRALEPGEWEKISHGFIGRGFKLRDRSFTFCPCEWHPVAPLRAICSYCGRNSMGVVGNCEGCGAPK